MDFKVLSDSENLFKSQSQTGIYVKKYGTYVTSNAPDLFFLILVQFIRTNHFIAEEKFNIMINILHFILEVHILVS